MKNKFSFFEQKYGEWCLMFPHFFEQKYEFWLVFSCCLSFVWFVFLMLCEALAFGEVWNM